MFYVSTDQDGNFRVGEYFRIDQAAGRATLNASAFDLAGLTSLRLGSIGAQLGETINEFSSDVTMSGNSNVAVPTEAAVKTYVDNRVNNINLNSIVGPATINSPTGAAFSQGYTVFSNSMVQPISWSLTGTVPSGVSIDANTGTLTGNSSVAAGTYTFTIVATDALGTNLSRSITLNESSAVPLFSSAAFPATIAPNSSYTINATTATSSATITYALASGSLPDGLS